MGAVAPILDLTLKSDEVLIAAGEDLKDFYYYYIISESRAARNSLAFELTMDEAKEFKAFSSARLSPHCRRIVPALRTMAMGDLNSVEFGQQSHFLLSSLLGVRQSDLVTLRGRFPRQNWAVGIVIDDFIVLEKLSREKLASPSPQDGVPLSTTIADAMVEAYESVGLVPNDKKRFRQELNSKFWGISLEGDEGLRERSLPIAFITASVARMGAATRKLLEILTGAWTAILQCRRRAMCLLDRLFSAIHEHDYGEVFALDEAAVEELWALVVLCPVFCTDLRADVSDEFSLVDASDAWEAEVVTTLEPELAEECFRQKMTKAAWSRLLSPFKALMRVHRKLDPQDEVPEGEVPARTHPLWAAIATSAPFSTKWRKKVRGRQHINVSELDAYLSAELRKARRRPNSKLLLGTDSQVTLGAVVKGRSSSAVLNRQLRRALPDILGYNVYSASQYITSADNVADDPTRDRDCREPTNRAPAWAVEIASGNFTGLDAELSAVDLGDADVARLPEDYAPQSVPVKSLSDRTLRRRQFLTMPTRTRVNKGRCKPPPVARARPQPWMPRTRLTSECLDALRRIPVDQFVLPRGYSLEEVIGLSGHLDLFSGSRGAAKALANRTGRWVLCYDLSHAARENLLDPVIQSEVESLLKAGAFLTLTGGPVCASFSRAVRPPVRSKKHPLGFDDLSETMQKKVAQGNAFADWVSKVIDLALQRKMIFWIENPATSYFWHHPSIVAVIKHWGLEFFTTDYCRWGTAWRKRTRFLANFQAAGSRCLCQCNRPHLQLKGYSRQHKISWTKVAESYPLPLCRFLAIATAESLKPASRRADIDASACARCNHRRIGEAKNPGPRKRQVPPGVDLEQVRLVQPATVLLQSKVHSRYCDWLATKLSRAAVSSLQDHPHLQVQFLRSYGNFLFNSGEPMYIFRHLVVYLQQMFPSEKPHMSSCWDLLAKWESVMPVTHRPPLPKLVLDAMVSLALTWGWTRWAALTSLTYHGAMRIGEPLKATREDLLLPQDAGLGEPVIFLRVGAPKPGRRGKGRVQHARIADELCNQTCRVRLCRPQIGRRAICSFSVDISPEVGSTASSSANTTNSSAHTGIAQRGWCLSLVPPVGSNIRHTMADEASSDCNLGVLSSGVCSHEHSDEAARTQSSFDSIKRSNATFHRAEPFCQAAHESELDCACSFSRCDGRQLATEAGSFSLDLTSQKPFPLHPAVLLLPTNWPVGRAHQQQQVVKAEGKKSSKRPRRIYDECGFKGLKQSESCVLFGGTLEAAASKLGLPVAKLTDGQRQMSLVKILGTAGSAVGVLCGCLLGMGNLMFLDLNKVERQKKHIAPGLIQLTAGDERTNRYVLLRPHQRAYVS
eukprot:Skav211699  [mRNA]  locus=scaffold1535:189530:207134:+ [translate_table: standard]